MQKLKSKCLIIMSLIFLGCNEKPTINLFKETQKGNLLEMAQEISVSNFFQIWIRRGIPWKANVEITHVYTDQFNVYFYERLNLKNSSYLGNRKFERGIEQLFKVDKIELKNEFGFYRDLDPMGIKGIDLKREFLKKVSLNETDLNNGVLEYKLNKRGIQVTLKMNQDKYESFYNSISKKFE